mgnify:FL=1
MRRCHTFVWFGQMTNPLVFCLHRNTRCRYLIGPRQIGHTVRLEAQLMHTQKWPQGTMTVSFGSARHTTQSKSSPLGAGCADAVVVAPTPLTPPSLAPGGSEACSAATAAAAAISSAGWWAWGMSDPAAPPSAAVDPPMAPLDAPPPPRPR